MKKKRDTFTIRRFWNNRIEKGVERNQLILRQAEGLRSILYDSDPHSRIRDIAHARKLLEKASNVFVRKQYYASPRRYGITLVFVVSAIICLWFARQTHNDLFYWVAVALTVCAGIHYAVVALRVQIFQKIDTTIPQDEVDEIDDFLREEAESRKRNFLLHQEQIINIVTNLDTYIPGLHPEVSEELAAVIRNRADVVSIELARK